MKYEDIKIEDIINWCVANGETEWLKETAQKMTTVKVYPRKKEVALDKDGNPIVNKKGKIKHVSVADKTKEPKIEERPISFIQLKVEFVEKFMPELAPKAKEKKPTMYDLIAAL